MDYFVEKLTLWTWVSTIYPRLLKASARTGRRVDKCYFIDGEAFPVLIARALGRVIGMTVERFTFRLAEVHDQAGLSIQLRVLHQDLPQVQQFALGEPFFLELTRNGSIEDRLPMFLSKSLALAHGNDPGNFWRALVLMHVCLWKSRQQEDEGNVPVLFLERRPWHSAIARYASDGGISIVTVRAAGNVRSAVRRRLSPQIIDLIRQLRSRLSSRGVSRSINRPSRSTSDGQSLSKPVASVDGPHAAADNSTPRVAVEYYGMLNLNQPERYSDLFFWQQSSLAGSDLLLTYSSTRYPLNDQHWTELAAHGIGSVVLHPEATTLREATVFKHRRKVFQPRQAKLSTGMKRLEGAWLDQKYAEYRNLRSYWADLASSHNIKVYVSWYKYNANHLAIADALQSVGGITVIYQRAYEDHPSSNNTVGSDIVFGYSRAMAEIERRSNSNVRYYVATGYLGDHRSRLVRQNSQTVRDRLHRQGAKNILAYFDENSTDDPRWGFGHHGPQEDYAFLLEKVLTEPGVGLVIKPKVPGTLRRRLGPVAQLLERAESTGRCYVFEADPSSPYYGEHPPVEAALAADVAIHGYLASATAGIEAALAGIPTLLMDREGWSVSPLYQLGVGTTVFTDWDILWEACQDHWSSATGIPGFGKWSSMLDQIDPFRDGHAAERMGNYIQWLIQGFKNGLDRDTIMADAAERYCAKWGRDKITEVNSGRRLFTPASADYGEAQLLSR